jgi:hypothetical protein
MVTWKPGSVIGQQQGGDSVLLEGLSVLYFLDPDSYRLDFWAKYTISCHILVALSHTTVQRPFGTAGEGVAEWLASRTRNREVAGSSLAFARKIVALLCESNAAK